MSEIKKIIKLLEQFDQSSNYTSMQKNLKTIKLALLQIAQTIAQCEIKIETETALPAIARGIWLGLIDIKVEDLSFDQTQYGNLVTAIQSSDVHSCKRMLEFIRKTNPNSLFATLKDGLKNCDKSFLTEKIREIRDNIKIVQSDNQKFVKTMLERICTEGNLIYLPTNDSTCDIKPNNNWDSYLYIFNQINNLYLDYKDSILSDEYIASIS